MNSAYPIDAYRSYLMKDMTNSEALQMMYRCKHEITNLRAEINRLTPKAQAYDNISLILRLLPQPSSSMGEDLVWVLESRIKELTKLPEPIGDAGSSAKE